MMDRDPLDDILAQPDRPTAPSPDFRRRLHTRLMAELTRDTSSGGDNPTMMHRTMPLPMGLPAARPKPSVRQPIWLVGLEAAAVVLLALGIIAALSNARGFPDLDSDRNHVAAPLLATPEPSTSSAAMSGGDAARSGTQPGPGPAGEIARLWLIAPNPGYVKANPPVALGDRLYEVVAETSADNLATDTYLDAFDAMNGDRLWRLPLNVFGSPAVTERMVYATVIEADATAVDALLPSALVAVDADTGREAWSVPLGDLTGAFGSSPIVVGDTVYAADSDGTVYARDAATGSERWTSTAARSDDPRTEARGNDEGENLGGSGTIAVGDNHVYVVNARGQLFALEDVTGAVRWSFAIRDRFTIAPEIVLPIAVDGGVLLKIRGDVGEGTPTRRIDLIALVEANTGDGLHTLEFTGLVGDLAVADGLVLVPTFDGSATQVGAIDLASGEPAWGESTSSHGALGGPVSVVDGVAYVADRDGTVHALDVGTGEERWTVETPWPINSAPVVSGGRVIVAHEGGLITALGNPALSGTPTASR